MKEMVYKNAPLSGEDKQEILYEGSFKDVRFLVTNCQGMHPCAYVFCQQEFLDSHATSWYGLDCISIHGGVSYQGQISELKGLGSKTGICFGWDYGHDGDWMGYLPEETNLKAGARKYTTMDVVHDCHLVIEQYLEALKKDMDDLPSNDLYLTPELLKSLGFKSVFEGKIEDDSILQKSGTIEEKKWKVYIDMKHRSKTYVTNEAIHRRYEGSLKSLNELKKVVSLCKIPIVF